MGNTDTIKAIMANLIDVLTVQGFLIENSSTDKELTTSPLCVIEHRGESFGASHGERPDYNDIRFSLLISFSDANPSTSRDKIAEWMHKIRNNVTVTNLNTGGLAASKLVSWVKHDDYERVGYAPPVTDMEYRLRVQYRET